MLPPKSILQLDHARSFWAQRLVPAKNPLSKFQAPRTLHRGFEFNPVFCRGSKPPPKTGLSPATKNLSRFKSLAVLVLEPVEPEAEERSGSFPQPSRVPGS